MCTFISANEKGISKSNIVLIESCQHFKSICWAQNSFEKPEGKPVDKFCDWNKADSETKTTDTPKVGDEVQPRHPLRSFKLWKWGMWEILRPKTVAVALKKWCFNTKYSWTSKEDVQYSYILLIGIVVTALLDQSEGVFKFRENDLGKRDKQLSLCAWLPLAWIS